MRTFLSTLVGAMLILTSCSPSEGEKVILSSDVDLPQNVGKQVIIEGNLQHRKSGLWLKCGRVAVELRGVKAGADAHTTTAATGPLNRTNRWFDGYMQYSMECLSLKILPGTSKPSTRPAIPVNLTDDANLADELERHRGERVTIAGKPETRKSGRWLKCGSIAIQLVPGEGERCDVDDMDRTIELTGWLTKVHMPELPPISEPGAVHAAHMGPGDWYGLEEAERVVKK